VLRLGASVAGLCPQAWRRAAEDFGVALVAPLPPLPHLAE